MSDQINSNRVSISKVVWFQEGPGVRKWQYRDSGVKLLNVANLVNGKLDLSTSDRYISEEEAYGKYKHFLVDKGDLIIASSGIVVDTIDKKMGFANSSHLPLCMNTSTIRFKPINPKEISMRFFMYFLKSYDFKSQLSKLITGIAQLNYGPSHLKKITMPVPPISDQQRIVAELDCLNEMIAVKEEQLKEFDKLAQSIFYDMFGDIESNSKGFELMRLDKVCNLKAGKAIKAEELQEESDGLFPCYGGNGVRGYIYKYSHDGIYPIIGRQGALCGNINLAQGKFYATEHAVVVSSLVEMDSIWLSYTLTSMKLEKYAHGVAQPGLSVKDLNPLLIPLPPLSLQQQFAEKISAIEAQKELVKQSIAETQKLLDYTMDKYFGYD